MDSRELSKAESRRGPFRVREVVDGYDARAGDLIEEFERLSFEAVHAPVLDLLPGPAGCVLDVGAGSGRDAAWFAAKGHRVVAVEPSGQLRSAARERHRSPNIQWTEDTLPALDRVWRANLTFDLIWMSAVWVHLPPPARAQAFRKLASLLSPGGSMMVTLRHGPIPPGRPMAPATATEIEALARRHGLQTIRSEHRSDVRGRTEVSWDVLWLRLPDDGTGALPLLRHVVFNDRKSSTYKLALLRTLIRIADSAEGFARPGRNDRYVDLPLGLVALFWVRAFRPLIAHGLPQRRGRGGLAFVKEGFHGLETLSPYDLKVGRQFDGSEARNLLLAIRDAARCIQRMPATHTKYPGSSEPVFPCNRRSGPGPNAGGVRLDEAFLWSFGTFSVPTHLWQSMGRYAAWIEPAVLNEWIEIMRGNQQALGQDPGSWDQHLEALRWLDAEHETGRVRKVVRMLRENESPLYCVWTGRRLTGNFDIDHCFPFAAWPCNDLWNLLPSTPAVNRRKADLLPAPEALAQARERMEEWWQRAYRRNDALARQFQDECRSALPMSASDDGRLDLSSVFEGVMTQQWKLKRYQGLREWAPGTPRQTFRR